MCWHEHWHKLSTKKHCCHKESIHWRIVNRTTKLVKEAESGFNKCLDNCPNVSVGTWPFFIKVWRYKVIAEGVK